MYRNYKPKLHSCLHPLVVQAFCCLSSFLNNWRRRHWELWEVDFRGPPHEIASLAGNLGRIVNLELAVHVRLPACPRVCVRAPACPKEEGTKLGRGEATFMRCVFSFLSFSPQRMERVL